MVIGDLKKYLIVTIMTIDFPDDPIRGMMRAMDINSYALETIQLLRSWLRCRGCVAGRLGPRVA
jgi:hypothetical protein